VADPYGYRALKVYRLAYRLAMEIYRASKDFPIDERYSLTDQIRRSSRSIVAAIVEGYRKRYYQRLFLLKLVDADGECAETQVWLDFAKDCGYLTESLHRELAAGYFEIGKMLAGMKSYPEKFARGS